jgi:hypothetical protein
MPPRHNVEEPTMSAPAALPGSRRWLLFVHQLPSLPSNLRVRTWRRLQQLGAIPIKQAVYVLPDTANAREDFEWLRTEVKDAGGDATVFAADHIDAWSADALVEEFRRSRQEAYASLARDVERVLGRIGARRRRGTRAPAVRRSLDVFRERVTAIESVDFFGSAGRDRVTTLLKQLEDRISHPDRPNIPGAAPSNPAAETYHGRLWVTRPRPGIDRTASAWLIKRFIDPEARFGFARDRDTVPGDGVPFDMFGVEVSHQGDGCTFETLCAMFGLQDRALARIATIVHDLDLKDGRFGAPEAPTLGAIIEGLQLAQPDDHALLAEGMTLFESLYRAFERSARSAGPRPLARTRKTGTARRRRRRS